MLITRQLLLMCALLSESPYLHALNLLIIMKTALIHVATVLIVISILVLTYDQGIIFLLILIRVNVFMRGS